MSNRLALMYALLVVAIVLILGVLSGVIIGRAADSVLWHVTETISEGVN